MYSWPSLEGLLSERWVLKLVVVAGAGLRSRLCNLVQDLRVRVACRQRVYLWRTNKLALVMDAEVKHRRTVPAVHMPCAVLCGALCEAWQGPLVHAIHHQGSCRMLHACALDRSIWKRTTTRFGMRSSACKPRICSCPGGPHAP